MYLFERKSTCAVQAGWRRGKGRGRESQADSMLSTGFILWPWDCDLSRNPELDAPSVGPRKRPWTILKLSSKSKYFPIFGCLGSCRWVLLWNTDFFFLWVSIIGRKHRYLDFDFQKHVAFISFSSQYVLWSEDKKKKKKACYVPLLSSNPHVIKTCCLIIPQCKIAIMSNFLGKCGWLNGLPMLLIIIPKFTSTGRTRFSTSHLISHHSCYIKNDIFLS